MPSLILPLPNDIESLQRLVREQQAALHSHALVIEKLKLELARLKRWKFGDASCRIARIMPILLSLVPRLQSAFPSVKINLRGMLVLLCRCCTSFTSSSAFSTPSASSPAASSSAAPNLGTEAGYE